MDNKKNHNFNWFPGHMKTAMRKIKEQIKNVNIILEVRDARVPLATSNDYFIKQLGNKPRLILLNKSNLANEEATKKWQTWFEKNEDHFVFVDIFDKSSTKKIIELSKNIVLENQLKSNPDAEMKSQLKMMVIGLPNTGKSTIINRLAGKDATKVADKPGQTTNQIWVKASHSLRILDTPGVMPPAIETEEQANWLFAINAIPEKLGVTDNIACYLLKCLMEKNKEFLENHYKIAELESDWLNVLNQIGVSRGCLKKKGEIDYERVYKLIINDFRKGSLGPISFELP